MKNYSSNVNNTVCGGEEMEDSNGSYIDKDFAPRDSPVTGLSNEECRTLMNLLQKTNIQKQNNVDAHEVQINQAYVGQHDTGIHYAFLNHYIR